jgi:RND family efflux transporter MFP subunit
MKKKKIILIVLGIIIVLFLVIIINPFSKTLGSKAEQGDDSSNVPSVGNNEIEFPVTAAIVRKGNLVSWINTSGYAYPVQDYEIKPHISGRVTELNTFDGEEVKKGNLLFKLDDTEYQLELNTSKNDLVKAQIEYYIERKGNVADINTSDYKHTLDSLKSAYDSAKTQYANRQISIDNLSRIKRDYEVLQTLSNVNREDVIESTSGLTSAIANYDKAKLNLTYTQLLSPINGITSDCKISKGSYVNAGDLCMHIIDIADIKIHCEVTETDLVKIHVGNIVKANFLAIPQKEFPGKVIEINPSVDIDKRTALVTVLIDNPDLLVKPGMFASVEIGTDILKDIIIIPHSALLARENRTLVFTINKGLAIWKYVTPGIANETYYSIKDGLDAGDTIIIGGNYNLAHQSKVKIVSMKNY